MNWYKKAKLISLPEKDITPIKNFIAKIFSLFQKEKPKLKTPENKNSFLHYYTKIFYVTYDDGYMEKLMNIRIKFVYDFLKPSAYYSTSSNSVTLNFSKITSLYGPYQLNDTLNTAIEHEIIHHIQTTGYQNEEEQNVEGGLPKKQLRNKEHNPQGFKIDETGKPISKRRQPHLLRDIEFYPNINYVYHQIKSQFPNANNEQLKQLIVNNKLLGKLKQYNYNKWKNAVIILYQALQNKETQQYLPTKEPAKE